MKKVLLGTTALLGAGLVASPAFAADGIKLGVGGFFKTAYMLNFDDNSEGEPGDDHSVDGVFSDAEVHFKGSTTLDNGLEVGARVELEGENANDQIDEAWIYFSGGFGEIRMGSDDEALANACIVPPGGTGNFSAFSPNQWGANTFTSNTICTGVDDKGDAQKLIYISPVFAGFQLTASYTPNGGAEDQTERGGPHTGMPFHNEGESRHNGSVYLSYSYEGDGWGLTAGGGASFEGAVESGHNGAPDRDTQDFYQAGLNLTFGNFAIGGVFEWFNDGVAFSSFHDNGVNQEATQWGAGVGIAYTMDAFTVGAQYSHEDFDIDSNVDPDADATINRVVLTGNYAMGPGINIDGELGYTWQNTDEGAFFDEGTDNYHAFEIGIGTNITF